jgi:hypothetical protein
LFCSETQIDTHSPLPDWLRHVDASVFARGQKIGGTPLSSVFTRDGCRQFTAWMPAELLDAIKSLAKKNRRSIGKEFTHAVQRHLESPPEVVIVSPPLTQSVLQFPGPLPRRPVGRPRKFF